MLSPSSQWLIGTGSLLSSRGATRSPHLSHALLAAALATSSARNGWVWRVFFHIQGTRENRLLLVADTGPQVKRSQGCGQSDHLYARDFAQRNTVNSGVPDCPAY